jgi:hypothetical protein
LRRLCWVSVYPPSPALGDPIHVSTLDTPMNTLPSKLPVRKAGLHGGGGGETVEVHVGGGGEEYMADSEGNALHRACDTTQNWPRLHGDAWHERKQQVHARQRKRGHNRTGSPSMTRAVSALGCSRSNTTTSAERARLATAPLPICSTAQRSRHSPQGMRGHACIRARKRVPCTQRSNQPKHKPLSRTTGAQPPQQHPLTPTDVDAASAQEMVFIGHPCCCSSSSPSGRRWTSNAVTDVDEDPRATHTPPTRPTHHPHPPQPPTQALHFFAC